VNGIGDDHRLMRHLFANGVPVPELVETSDGATALVRDGELIELQSWIEHDSDLSGFEFPAVSTKLCAALGTFHRAARRFNRVIHKPAYLRGTLLPVEARTKYFTGPLEHGVPRYRRAASALPHPVREEYLTSVDSLADRLAGIAHAYEAAHHAGPLLVNHGDFYENNILFNAGKVAGIVDFDFCQTALYAVDLIEALHGAMVWHTCEEQYLGLTQSGEVRLSHGQEALQSYLAQMPDLMPDGRFLVEFLIAKVISLAFFPAFDFWQTPEEKFEGLARVQRTIAALEEIGELAT
jgi:predicted ester cyclase